MAKRAHKYHIKVTTANKKKGAIIKWNSKLIDGSMSLSIGLDTAGYGGLFYYGDHHKGNRAYKVVTTDPSHDSPGIKIKVVDKSQTVHLDGWSVQFYRTQDYMAVVEALRVTSFLSADKNTNVVRARKKRTVVSSRTSTKKAVGSTVRSKKATV